MILLSELYNKLKHYEYEGNSSVDSFYKDLRSYIKGGYLPIHGYLSDRQSCVFENAVNMLLRGDYASALVETLDFMHNYQDNNHEITNEEYTCLNIILIIYESRCV